MSQENIVSMGISKSEVKIETDNKLPSEMTQEEILEWRKKPATHEEVESFVSNYISNQIVPAIMESVGRELFLVKSQLRVLQSMTIGAGLITEQEYEENLNKYIEDQKAKLKEEQSKSTS